MWRDAIADPRHPTFLGGLMGFGKRVAAAAAVAALFAGGLAQPAAAATNGPCGDTEAGMTLGNSDADLYATLEVTPVDTEAFMTKVRDLRAEALAATEPHFFDFITIKRVHVRDYLADHGISEQQYLNPTWSLQMERIAFQRAAEQAPNHGDDQLTHNRSNSDPALDTNPPFMRDNGLQASGTGYDLENLAWAPYPQEMPEVMKRWGDDERDVFLNDPSNATNFGAFGHYMTIIDPDMNSFGGAVLWDPTTRESYAVLANTGDKLTDTSSTGWSGACEFRIPLHKDRTVDPAHSEAPGTTDPVEPPADPAEPGDTDPADPANPVDPANPGDTDPANPADPTEPGDTTDPANPAEPAVDPANPGDTDPANPGDTTDPANPVNPGDTDPANPADPANPGDTDPANPGDTTDPANPVDPANPSDPTDLPADDAPTAGLPSTGADGPSPAAPAEGVALMVLAGAALASFRRR